MTSIDATDRRILRVLDEDPRMSAVALAQHLGLARGTVQSRLARLGDAGVLRPNSTRVEPAAIGRPVTADVSVELNQHEIQSTVDQMSRIPEVLECFAPAGDTDLLVRVVARTPDDLYRVSEQIRLCPGVVRTQTSMFLRRVISYRVSALLRADDDGTADADDPEADAAETDRADAAAQH